VPSTGVKAAVKVIILEVGVGIGVGVESSLLEQEAPIKNKHKIAEKPNTDFIIYIF
jgi:hypothetical protein